MGEVRWTLFGNNFSVCSHSNPRGGNFRRGGSVGGVSFPHGKDPCEGVERVGRLPSTQTKILSRLISDLTKKEFLGLVLNTEGTTLTSALLILIGGISRKLVLEYGNFWDCFSSN